jgi:farnesyl-diphosphate farnesyltransferase
VNEPVDLERLLLASSRTFALAIPYLPEPTRSEVTLAYLLFRVADTFEDATSWPRASRIAALEELNRLLEEAPRSEVGAAARRWAAEVPCEQPAYRDLLAQLPGVLDAFFALRPPAVELIRDHTGRTAHGMAGFVARTSDDGEIRLLDAADLKAYCYVVAGIVGELLTELFLLERPELHPAAPDLRRLSRAFGEGLQLVNILKDSESDKRNGKRYLPESLPRADVLAVARRDLTDAADYVLTLQRSGAPRGLLAFTTLPVELAFATLDRVEAEGPGAKVRRTEVYALVDRMNRALDAGEPAIRLAVAGLST